MGSLAGLVNYSDDDDFSSSSSDEQTQVSHILAKKGEKEVVTTTAIAKKKESASTTIATTNKITPPPAIAINEYNKRLMSAIAPKPFETVDNWGIPNEPNTACDLDRAERIAHFLSLRSSGHRLNDHLQHNKAFRNPRIYTRLVEFAEVDEFGSNFDRKDFDPHGFPKEMYIDGILETQKKLAEEKALQQQNRTSLNFVPPQNQFTEQQSSAMAQAMATAAKVASRIAKPPTQDISTPPNTLQEKRRNKWDDDYSNKR